MLLGCCLSSVLTVCDVGVLWPNGCMDQDETWYGGRPRLRRHCVRWRRNPQKGAQQTPAFRPMSIVAKRLDESRCHLLGTEVGYGDIVLDGDPAPPTKKGNAAPPTFLAKRLYASGYR